VKGRTSAGRALHVIYVLRAEHEVEVRLLSAADKAALEEGEHAVYVTHARPLRRGER